MFDEIEVLDERLKEFVDNLPKKPYCSNNLTYGTEIRPKKLAIRRTHIQHNTPFLVRYMVFDIDYAGVLEHISHNNLPTPSIAVFNKLSGKSHLFYELDAPVAISDISSNYARTFLANVYSSLRRALKADINYKGLISKNPINPQWHTITFHSVKKYTLKEFKEWIDIPLKLNKEYQGVGYGRNCTVFDIVRHKAYKAVNSFDKYDLFHRFVHSECQEINSTFVDSLYDSEIRAISKSIAKWTWRNNSYKYKAYTHSSKQQSLRGKKSGKARLEKTLEDRVLANMLSMFGMSNHKISSKLKCSRSSVIRWLKD